MTAVPYDDDAAWARAYAEDIAAAGHDGPACKLRQIADRLEELTRKQQP